MVKDYKGQEFESYKQMAENYHLTYQTFLWRRKSNWSLEECLTGKKAKHKSTVDVSKRTDHLGVVYQTVEDMCKAWNVTLNNYHIRKSRGYSLEECLTGIKNIIRDKSRYEVEDHLGNKFESKRKMCEYYNIAYYTYLDRLRRGLSMEESLTSYELGKVKCKDHLGNEFNSIKEMCKYWKVTIGAYCSRRKRGLSIEDCLTMESEHSSITDHLGNKFHSKSDLCSFYNIPCNTYRYRIKCGWSQEKALTTKVNGNITEESRTDYLGNQFNSIEEMCEYYGITKETYEGRIQRGWTKRKALLTLAEEGRTVSEEDRTDHKGNVFNSRIEMLKFYECSLGQFYRGLKNGKTKDEILRKCEDRMNRKIIAEKNWIVDNLIYTASSGTMYYVCCRDDGTEEVLSVNEVRAM